jgi:hypothetical protein
MMADTELLQELREIKNLLQAGRQLLLVTGTGLKSAFDGVAVSETDRWIQAVKQLESELELRVRGPFIGGAPCP